MQMLPGPSCGHPAAPTRAVLHSSWQTSCFWRLLVSGSPSPSLAFTSHPLWGTAPSSVIRTDPSLHKPRYRFLAMLVISDLGLSLLLVMSIFWVNYRKTSLDAYFVQGYLIHSFSFLESSLLLAIAFDHRVGICYPLKYSSILTIARISRIGLAALCRCLLGVLSLIFVLSRFSCRSHVCSHAYCLHQDLIKLVCADITFNSIYRLAVVILKIVLDPLLIVSSRIMICKKILSIASQREHLKALNN